jgi:hypothetical protein
MWNEIISENDLNDFLVRFGYFHDSCIKEIKYIGGAYVDEYLSMNPINSDRTAKIIFQRQYCNPSVIEMEFIGLSQLSIYPQDDNYTCEIVDATMIKHDDYIYWCDCGGLSEIDFNAYRGTLICASRVRWRIADEYIGQREIYRSV